MGVEIERKFLIDETKLPTLQNGYTIKQGYIQTIDHTTVRIRVRGQEAFLTIKGKSQGATRLEFEYPISLNDAEEMLTNLCHASHVEKTRYLVEYEGHTWEVDIFEGSNKGLMIAEIELKSEDEAFPLPEWVTKEVTEDVRYFNANLVERPYTSW
ncbi:CYTH domain-containing protein [Sulfurovum sp. XTW-4]|uniref:CYTH domain-containing protein n=1 Tax=Sulfurovum xiamenensis TaxID=3019066 RepID=A0ABT7QUN6_9BACT|nr:CYTH domain-containing protein [Sulfurovum xiamenensis]MDM5264659.1 CYTH domain-containing protein [Sulfurovum xiamenensis]